MKKTAIEDVLSSWTGITDDSQLKRDIIGAMEEWANSSNVKQKSKKRAPIKYFHITDMESDVSIGVVAVTTNKELTDKVRQACVEHFDNGDLDVPSLDMLNYEVFGSSVIISVEGLSQEIHIEPTWLY